MAKSTLKPEDTFAVLRQRLGKLGIGPEQFRQGGSFEPVGFLPTGQMEIDAIIGDGGGIPRGTVVEFCGESQSGKTYVSYRLMAEAQKRGERVCYANVENSFYPPRASSLGVQVENEDLFTLLENIPTAEAYGEAVYAMVESGLFTVIVVDSISSLVPETEYEKDLSDPSTIGAHARFVKRFVKKLLGLCQKHNVIVVLINQLYMGTGVMPGQMVSQATGGNAMSYFPHMRLWFKRINGANGKVLGKDGEIIGGKSKITVTKTRYGQPWVESEFPIMFGDAESDPIAEFIFKAKAKGAEYIKEVRKVYRYEHPDTGEVCAEKVASKFILELANLPAPDKRTRGDNSTTVLEYICGRIKMTPAQMSVLLEACESQIASSEENDESDEEE